MSNIQGSSKNKDSRATLTSLVRTEFRNLELGQYIGFCYLSAEAPDCPV